MKHIYGIALLLVSGIGATAQNLVPNPGFEQMDKCPPFWSEKQSDLTASFWESPTTATPDNFTACSELSGVPNNWAGVMKAHGGTAYAGFIARRNFGRSTDDPKNRTHREYLQTKLKSTLLKGAEYKVTFYVSLAENCRLASDGIGAYFSKSAIDYRFMTNRFMWDSDVISFIAGQIVMTSAFQYTQRSLKAAC